MRLRPHRFYAERVYRGRLVTIDGVLTADEGSLRGLPVYAVVDTAGRTLAYRVVGKGGLSHNARHHERTASFAGTTPELDDVGVPLHPHHFAVQPNDPHYAADGGTIGLDGIPTHVRLRFDPDEVAARLVGHTDAYTR